MTYCKLYPDANVCKPTNAEEPESSDECPNAPTDKNNEYGQKCCLDTRYSSLAVCQQAPNEENEVDIHAGCHIVDSAGHETMYTGEYAQSFYLKCYISPYIEGLKVEFTFHAYGYDGANIEYNQYAGSYGDNWHTVTCSASACDTGYVYGSGLYYVISGIKACNLYKDSQLIGSGNLIFDYPKVDQFYLSYNQLLAEKNASCKIDVYNYKPD